MESGEAHPLRIAEVPAGEGMIGFSPCPSIGDIAAIRAWGAAAVVTLVETAELDLIGVPDLPPAIAAAFDWHHLPIRDFCVPDAAFEAAWPGVAPALHAVLAAGGRVLLHCRGGLGRSGMVAALMLIEQGQMAEAAIAAVRAARPGAVETEAQERWLKARACRP